MDHSEDAKVFVLVHKMDLIESPIQKQTVFEAKRQQLEKIATSYEVKVDYSRTSIWDKTLYSAWSRIVTQLVPNRHLFEKELNQFVQKSEADEGKSKVGCLFLSSALYHTGCMRNFGQMSIGKKHSTLIYYQFVITNYINYISYAVRKGYIFESLLCK